MCLTELSIIVPVYNVEAYIDDAIKSIRRQTYKQWELILVDDGSSDSTPSICDRYSIEDSRIKVIHIPNSGPGKARNIGITHAKGSYVTFIDADDEYGMDTTLEENMNILRGDSSIDVLQFPYEQVAVNGKSKLVKASRSYKLEKRSEILEHLSSSRIQGYIWNKIFDRKIFDRIRFPENISLTEDLWLMIDVALSDVKFYISTLGQYRYGQRPGSLMSTETVRKECHAFGTFYRLLRVLYDEPDVADEYRAGWYMRVVSLLIKINSLSEKEDKVSIEEIHQYTPRLNVLFKPLRFDLKVKLLMLKMFGCNRYVKFRTTLRNI